MPDAQVTIEKQKLMQQSQEVFSRFLKEGIENSLQNLDLKKLNYYPTDERCRNRDSFKKLSSKEKFNFCQALPYGFTYGFKFSFSSEVEHLEPTSLKINQLSFRDFILDEKIDLKEITPGKYQLGVCLKKATIFGDFSWQSLITGEMIYYDPYARVDYEQAEDKKLCFDFIASFEEVAGTLKLNVDKEKFKLRIDDDINIRNITFPFIKEEDSDVLFKDLERMYGDNATSKQNIHLLQICSVFAINYVEDMDHIIDIFQSMEKILFKDIPFDSSIDYARTVLYNAFQEKKSWPSNLSNKEKAIFMMDQELSEEEINSSLFRKASENFSKRIFIEEREPNLFYFKLIHSIAKSEERRAGANLNLQLEELLDNTKRTSHEKLIQEESDTFLSDLARKNFQFYQNKMGHLDKDLKKRKEALINTFHNSWTTVNYYSNSLRLLAYPPVLNRILTMTLPYALNNINSDYILNKSIEGEKVRTVCREVHKIKDIQTIIDSNHIIKFIKQQQKNLLSRGANNVFHQNISAPSELRKKLDSVLSLAQNINTEEAKDAFLNFEAYLSNQNLKNLCSDCQNILEEISKIKEKILVEQKLDYTVCIDNINTSEDHVELFLTEKGSERRKDIAPYSDPSCQYSENYDKKVFISFDYLKKYINTYLFNEKTFCIRDHNEHELATCSGRLAKITEEATIERKSEKEVKVSLNIDLSKQKAAIPIIDNLTDFSKEVNCDLEFNINFSLEDKKISFDSVTESDCSVKSFQFLTLLLSAISPHFFLLTALSNVGLLLDHSSEQEKKDIFSVEELKIKHFCIGNKGLNFYLDF